MLDLDSIARYVDFEKMQNFFNKDFSILVRLPYRYNQPLEQINIVEMFANLRDIVEFLHPEVFFDFLKKSKSDLPKKFYAFLDNFEENREKAMLFLDDLSKYFFDADLQSFAEKNVASLFSTEFKGQVYPVNIKSKEKKSFVSISKNEEIGCSFYLFDKKKISANLSSRKLFLNNAIYVEDPYTLDRIIDDKGFLWLSDMDSRLEYSHEKKLKKLLLKNTTNSLIEQFINEERYNNIINKISEIIPGSLAIRDSGMYYEEINKEPLKVQNLATGSKMFSIIKNLLEKGEINFDTMLILDEPEAHLHPEWQNVLAEIIVLLVKKLDTHILLTTHSPNFLMALEAYSKKYELSAKTNYYMAEHNDDNYMVDYVCVNENLSKIYSSFALPLIKSKKLKED